MQRGLSMEGNLHFKINWASIIVGSKFTVFALFYFVFREQPAHASILSFAHYFQAPAMQATS